MKASEIPSQYPDTEAPKVVVKEYDYVAKDFGATTVIGFKEDDPNREFFTPEEERRLVRKIDFHVLAYITLLYLFYAFDRGNIGTARLTGIEADLHTSPSQFSLCLSIYYISYICCEVPSNLLLKKFSPSRWIAIIMVSWGLCTVLTATVQNFAGLLTVRLFLGITEAGLHPGLIFYLTFWYTRHEQSLRFALFMSVSVISNAFGGLISYGIAHLDGHQGVAAWRWIFIMEGVPTILLGMATWYYMANSPADASWLSEREKALVEIRLRNDFRDKLTTRFEKAQFQDALKDPVVWICMLIYFTQVTTLASIALLLPTILRDLGITNMAALLLSAPPFIIAAMFAMMMSYVSDKRRKRSVHVILQPLIGICGILMLILLKDIRALYAGACLTTLGAFSYNAIIMSWLTNNVVGGTKTATAAAMTTTAGSFGGIVAGQLYRHDEAPRYLRSHLVNLTALLLVSITACMLRLYLASRNRKLDESMVTTSESKKSAFRFTL
ncbi:MFS general substrate transporter [Basidiobolus meristosporus CBS 931.73]|uniref:MFS general substrate transporter n=1 Tax=Basidiobolus meristosporus CBS 931.73 TaxID=1314790 RepID=A0A1Y1XZ79_9FUNG|nr:MFS general substrate transporter [Basidiobolus meristosporus CBS 931.73]ORX91067.1 MFS general substrate transporter [Basidiobolus meristosporus CBS 931.73]|eukprot:ORX80152.1 MFS general substrate transporter [Basidiobolus meristosporus CBS 931.73]